jgi:hypothetical protein
MSFVGAAPGFFGCSTILLRRVERVQSSVRTARAATLLTAFVGVKKTHRSTPESAPLGARPPSAGVPRDPGPTYILLAPQISQSAQIAQIMGTANRVT